MSETLELMKQAQIAKDTAKPTQVSLVAGVNAAAARSIPTAILDKLQKQKFNTGEITTPYFRCFLYGEVDSGKSVCAAKFGTPENTRIILTRQKEQLDPLRKKKYEAFHANTVENFRYAVMYPEAIWPEWANLPDRTLIIDDITQVKDMLNDDNSFNDAGAEVKDIRKVSKGSKDDLRDMIQLSALTKPMNLIVTALERSWETGNEIRISPDLPPAMSNMLAADFEFVLNIRKINANARHLITETSREAFIKKDDKGKDTPYQIVRFARNKIPEELVGKGIIKPTEPADLRLLWEKVRAGKV